MLHSLKKYENKISLFIPSRFVHRYHLQKSDTVVFEMLLFYFSSEGSLKIRSTREKQKFAKAMWMLPWCQDRASDEHNALSTTSHNLVFSSLEIEEVCV